MKMPKSLAAAGMTLLFSFSAVQAADADIAAKELASWHASSLSDMKGRFESYVLTAYKSLIAEHEVCVPRGRTDAVNEAAAIEAVRMAMDEGVFDQDEPAKGAVKDALGFWFPCPLRR